MRRFFRLHRILAPAIATFLALSVVSVGAFVGVTYYNLNQTVECNVTINQPPSSTVQVQLYSDLLCTVPLTTLQFSTTDTNGSPFATAYFMSSNNVMGGKYASGIDGATIGVTSTILPTVGTVSFIVGSTSQSGNHGCPIIFMITPTALGATNLDFSVTVTGTGV